MWRESVSYIVKITLNGDKTKTFVARIEIFVMVETSAQKFGCLGVNGRRGECDRRCLSVVVLTL